MKKIISLALTAVLCFTLLTSCTTGDPELDNLLSNTLKSVSNSIGTGDETSETETDVTGVTDTGASQSGEDSKSENTDTEKSDKTKTNANSSNRSDSNRSDKEKAPYENAKYAYIQALIEENDCLGGIAYIDMVGSDWNSDYLRACVEYHRIEEYKTVFEHAAVVPGEGDWLFALLPGKGATISIYPTSLDDDYEFVDDFENPLYEGKVDEPVLLRCGISDIFSNVIITVTNGEDTYMLRPNLSGERAETVVTNEGWYDFASFDICSIAYEASYWFENLFSYYLEEELHEGYELHYIDSVYNANRCMLRFGMFLRHEDGDYDLGTEYYIDTTNVYRVNEEGYLEVIGSGIDFTSVDEAVRYVEKLWEAQRNDAELRDSDSEAVG